MEVAEAVDRMLGGASFDDIFEGDVVDLATKRANLKVAGRKFRTGIGKAEKFKRRFLGTPPPTPIERGQSYRDQRDDPVEHIRDLASMLQRHENDHPVVSFENQEKAYDHYRNHGIEGVKAETERLWQSFQKKRQKRQRRSLKRGRLIASH